MYKCVCLSLLFGRSITFYLAVGLTALSFVLERKEGLLDRCWVAGESIRIPTDPTVTTVVTTEIVLFREHSVL